MFSHLLWGFLNLAVASAMMRSSQSDLASSKDTLAGADIDAWLVMCQRKQDMLEYNMYTPILETVKVAMESKGAKAKIIGIADMDNMIGQVKAAVAQGRRPLAFAVGLQFAEDKEQLFSKFTEARKAGGYVVMYQTEPLFSDWRLTNQLRVSIDYAKRIGAHEMWDYSMAHTTNYPAMNSEMIVRYVPPGYVPKLDVGVDLNSPLTKAQGIGYMGRTNKQMHSKYMDVLAENLHVGSNIYSDDKVRAFLETYPLQLNQHRFQSCCPRNVTWEAKTQHFEAFRMATLLANKACVISAPSAEEDMRVWKDIVHFAEVEQTENMMKWLGGKLNECRKNSYETYKREFAASKVLSNSGFFNAWKPPHGK